MPNQQKATRTKITIALDRALKDEIDAEIERRAQAGDETNISALVSEALVWFLYQPETSTVPRSSKVKE